MQELNESAERFLRAPRQETNEMKVRMSKINIYQWFSRSKRFLLKNNEKFYKLILIECSVRAITDMHLFHLYGYMELKKALFTAPFLIVSELPSSKI